MKQGVPQASLRAQWYDHAELRAGAKMQDDYCELRMWQWRGAHEARALCAKQREVSPMSKGELQAVRRSRTTIAN